MNRRSERETGVEKRERPTERDTRGRRVHGRDDGEKEKVGTWKKRAQKDSKVIA